MFRDPRVIERARAFVCAADEVWRLQRGSDPECVFFQRAVNGGKRITDRGTRQGVYVFAPGGRMLARRNTRDPDAVLAMLDRAEEDFRALSAPELRLPPGAALDPRHRWEKSCPQDGLVLERIARDLSGPDPDSERIAAWNRDFAWFSRDEIDAEVPERLAPGDVFSMPLVARRLARFHLVDNARGQTLPYAPDEIAEARLDARVVSLDGDRVALELFGATNAVSDGSWSLGHNLWKPSREIPHAIRCVLAGVAEFDLRRRAFTTFELVAVGWRTGRTPLNGRGRDPSPGWIGFYLQVADPAPRIAPTFVALYDAPWIEQPEVPTWLESPAECGLEDGRR